MAIATGEWIRVAWSNESQKQNISLKKEAEKAMRKIEMTVSFNEQSVIIGEVERRMNGVGWKKLKKVLIEGQSLAEMELQCEIPKQYSEEEEDSG